MFGKKNLISVLTLLSIIFSASAQSTISHETSLPDRTGHGRFTGDRDSGQERTLSTSDYFASKVKSHQAKAPGVPIREIQNRRPPGNTVMSRMIREDNRDGSLMGGHE